jgi:diaminohydroxyphosphoribosylaminopyrimidine deaminase / 5-amino-6-(5-phosphoribosylamino)uracil reductase
MQEALKLASQARRFTYPNPAVGCVIVGPNHRGIGWHPRAGWPHAEVCFMYTCINCIIN